MADGVFGGWMGWCEDGDSARVGASCFLDLFCFCLGEGRGRGRGEGEGFKDSGG